MGTRPKYTCSDYREEMTLLSLRRRLAREELSEEEKRAIIEEIQRLEAIMRMNK